MRRSRPRMTLTWRCSLRHRAVEATSSKSAARGFLSETETPDSFVAASSEGFVGRFHFKTAAASRQLHALVRRRGQEYSPLPGHAPPTPGAIVCDYGPEEIQERAFLDQFTLPDLNSTRRRIAVALVDDTVGIRRDGIVDED